MPETTRYVTHDDKRWRVIADDAQVDGERMLQLRRRVGGMRARMLEVYARPSDCQPYHHGPRTRRARDGKHVLEVCGEAFTVRRARSPKRYSFTLKDLYEWAVRINTFKGARMPKALRARKGRR